MTDPEPASPPCQAPPGYWDADEETPPTECEAEKPAPPAGDPPPRSPEPPAA